MVLDFNASAMAFVPSYPMLLALKEVVENKRMCVCVMKCNWAALFGVTSKVKFFERSICLQQLSYYLGTFVSNGTRCECGGKMKKVYVVHLKSPHRSEIELRDPAVHPRHKICKSLFGHVS